MTQTRTTTYVTNRSSYVLRDDETSGLGFTVVSLVGSLGHCEGATKAVKGVRAATDFSPIGPDLHLFQGASLLSSVFWGFLVHRRPLHSSHPTSAPGHQRARSTEQVTFSGFSPCPERQHTVFAWHKAEACCGAPPFTCRTV